MWLRDGQHVKASPGWARSVHQAGQGKSGVPMKDDLQKEPVFVITEKWLSDWRSKNGGYMRAQLVVLGVDWPPRPGWKREVIGQGILQADAIRFQAASGKLPARVEARLVELADMGEFPPDDVAECRQRYWGARDDWHGILVRCYDRAKLRIAARAAAPRVGA